MNPLEMRKALAPLVGDEIASALARVAEQHKDIGAFSVSVPSHALVTIGEKFAELAGARTT
jgi:hypothetical protein